MMDFEELDKKTRECMLVEFDNEWSKPKHFESDELNDTGLKEFPKIMRKAIQSGTIETLANDLSNSSYWESSRTYLRKGKPVTVHIDPTTSSKRLAHSEFTTCYTHGLARKLMDEGQTECEIYRADKAHQPKCECTSLEGTKQPLEKIYKGHRAKYYPKKDLTAFSIPSVPHCHHTIRRIKKNHE